MEGGGYGGGNQMYRKLKEIESLKLENLSNLILHYLWIDLMMDYERSEVEEVLSQLVRVEVEIKRREV